MRPRLTAGAPTPRYAEAHPSGDHGGPHTRFEAASPLASINVVAQSPSVPRCGSVWTMRVVRCFYACLFLATMTGPASALDPLRLYTVRVGGGHGVYLGKGYVITAAHVSVGEPHVVIAERQLPAKVIKRGDIINVDLTLLSIDQHLPDLMGLKHMSLCQDPAKPGEAVLVGAPEGMLNSEVLSPLEIGGTIPPKYQKSLISYIARGNSGSGVFDPEKKCLLGIITQKLTTTVTKQMNGQQTSDSRDVAKYYVPASEIAQFIPSEIRY